MGHQAPIRALGLEVQSQDDAMPCKRLCLPVYQGGYRRGAVQEVRGDNAMGLEKGAGGISWKKS